MFGFKEGFSLWFRWSFIDPLQVFVWINITHKPWCTNCGYHCSEGCTAEKLHTKKEILSVWNRGVCDAILRFEGTPYFVSCEKEKNHEGQHKGLIYVWDGHDETVSDEIRQTGAEMFLSIIKRRML